MIQFTAELFQVLASYLKFFHSVIDASIFCREISVSELQFCNRPNVYSGETDSQPLFSYSLLILFVMVYFKSQFYIFLCLIYLPITILYVCILGHGDLVLFKHGQVLGLASKVCISL